MLEETSEDLPNVPPSPTKSTNLKQDDATLTLASPGDAATGGGWYTLSGNGRISFGFVVHKVPNTTKDSCS